MNISRRVVVVFLVAAIVLFAGMLFWPFILNNIIEPTALVVWLLLRILILSLDQKYFWWVVISIAVIFLFRILPWEQPVVQPDDSSETNATIRKIGYRRFLITYNGHDVQSEETLKQELIHLLTLCYASKQRISNNFGVYQALQQGEIPLPENIHTFLFPPKPQESGGLIKKYFQSVQRTTRNQIRHWTGQEKAEHYRMIEEVLHFMETSLEIKNDDRKFIHTEH